MSVAHFKLVSFTCLKLATWQKMIYLAFIVKNTEIFFHRNQIFLSLFLLSTLNEEVFLTEGNKGFSNMEFFLVD